MLTKLKGYKTILVNVLSFSAVVLGWDGLTQWLTPQQIAEALAFVNMWLRMVTTTPVGVKS